MSVFLEYVKSLEMVSRGNATLQRLDDVYIRKAFAKHSKSLSNSVWRCISVYWVYSE